jgi:uncharacterized membrane protein YphA (DoxX/SURF4 family)
MQSFERISRITLGLILVVFGLNHFFGNFMSIPMPAQAQEVLLSMGYWHTFVKVFEVLAGLALLSNRLVPLALLVLLPISLNIIVFHVLFDMKGALPGLVVAALTAFLIYNYFHFFKPFLKSKAHL